MRLSDVPPKVFGWLARTSLRHRWAVLAVALCVTIISAFLALPVRTDPQLVRLLPHDIPTVAATTELLNNDPGSAPLMIAIEPVPEAEQVDAVRELCDALADSAEVEQVFCEVPADIGAQLGALRLSDERLADLHRRLDALRRLGPAASNPVVAGRVLGPLDDLRPPEQQIGLSAGRLVLWPTGKVQTDVDAKRLMKHVHAAIDAAELDEHGMEVVWIGGTARHVAEDGPGMAQDLAWTGSLALVLCSLILWMGMGSLRGTALVLVPLLWANLLTLGLLHLLYGALNPYTVTALPILLGLGIDFGIHGVGRLAELRHERDLADALESAWSATGPPALVAAGTSVIGFLALASSDFLGFRQLGTALAIGLLLAFFAVYLLVPALVPWLPPPPGRMPWTRPRQVRSRPPARALAGGVLASILVGGVVAAVVGFPNLSVTTDTSSLRRAGLSYAELGHVSEHLEVGFAPAVLVLPPDEVADVQRSLIQAQERGELSRVGRVLSVQDVLTSASPQRVAAVRGLGAKAQVLPRGVLPPVLADASKALAALPEEGLTVGDLPMSLRRAVGAHHDDEHMIVLQVKGNQWDLVVAAEMVDQVLAVADQPLGVPATQHVLLGIVTRDLPWILGLALAGVVLAVGLGSGNLRRAVVVLVALAAAVGWVIGAIALFGIPLSLVSAPAVPILLGIGVDGAVHVAHRIFEEGRDGVLRALASSGGLALLSAITTTVGSARCPSRHPEASSPSDTSSPWA